MPRWRRLGSMIFIYTNYKTVEDTKKMAHVLIEKRLASGVNMWPVHSIFGVRGECKEAEGYLLMIRTNEGKMQEIEELIARQRETDALDKWLAETKATARIEYREQVFK